MVTVTTTTTDTIQHHYDGYPPVFDALKEGKGHCRSVVNHACTQMGKNKQTIKKEKKKRGTDPGVPNFV